MDSSELVERQVRFSDFRNVGGLLLPHKWTETVGGNTGETVDITSYEINPANIAEKFQNQKVFIRTKNASKSETRETSEKLMIYQNFLLIINIPFSLVSPSPCLPFPSSHLPAA